MLIPLSFYAGFSIELYSQQQSNFAWIRYQNRVNMNASWQINTELEHRSTLNSLNTEAIIAPRISLTFNANDHLYLSAGAANFSYRDAGSPTFRNGNYSELRSHAEAGLQCGQKIQLGQRVRIENRMFESPHYSVWEAKPVFRFRYLFEIKWNIPMKTKRLNLLSVHLGNEFMVQNQITKSGWKFNQNRMIPAVTFKPLEHLQLNLSYYYTILRGNITENVFRLTVIHTIQLANK